MQGQNNIDINPQEHDIPINESLQVIIPIDHEIIYSTRINVQYHIKDLNENVGLKHPARTGFIFGGIGGAIGASLGKKIIKAALNFHGNYDTDVLITNEGIALNLPTFHKQKKGNIVYRKSPSPHYVSWKNIRLSAYNTFEIDSRYTCDLSHFINNETKEQFNIRKQRFFNLIPKFKEEQELKYKKAADYSKILYSEQIQEIDQFLLDFFCSHQGNAFTKESLMKRLRTEMDNQEWLEYLEVHLRGELNKLSFNGDIESNKHEGKLFYFFP